MAANHTMELVKTETERQPSQPTPFQRISEEFQSLISRSAKLQLPDAPETCEFCKGFGTEITELGARPCRCKRAQMRDRVIAQIPERNRINGAPSLADLTPHLSREHEIQSEETQERILAWQGAMIRFAQANPFQSLVLCGSNKIGKSHIAYAMFLNAFDHFRRVRCFNLKDLLIDYARSARGEQQADGSAFVPRLTKSELAAPEHRYTILIDELHAPLPSLTEPQTVTVFELLDAIKANRHQLIALSNYPMNALRNGFRKHDKYLGDSIISRLQEEAVQDEMFI